MLLCLLISAPCHKNDTAYSKSSCDHIEKDLLYVAKASWYKGLMPLIKHRYCHGYEHRETTGYSFVPLYKCKKCVSRKHSKAIKQQEMRYFPNQHMYIVDLHLGWTPINDLGEPTCYSTTCCCGLFSILCR